MSVREGTRRKKISVLHMLGTWEGKIDGCNCPSCKEYEEEQVLAALACKTPTKLAKAVKVPRGSPKKTVIKVKTRKVVVDAGSIRNLVERKLSTKKYPALKREEEETGEPHRSNILQDFDCGEEYGASDSDLKSDGIGSAMKRESECANARTSEFVDLGLRDMKRYCKNSKDTVDLNQIVGRKRTSYGDGVKRGREKLDNQSSLENIKEEKCSPERMLAVSSRKDQRAKQNSEESPVDSLQIKQEPEEYFSDGEDFGRGENARHFSDRTKMDSRVKKKRARMVTSEVENIYAKPRMIFTGRGVVKKLEPGVDKTPKSRRGRKPAKTVSCMKVKQEPKEESEENELDQLQKALTEAAESLGVEDDLFDALNEFEEEPKEMKVRKKSKFKMLKRVDSDGDKYVECNMCFKMLKESSMKQHYKTHTGEKPHTCDECEARFTRKGDVERHKRLLHKNQKPFICKKCKRMFSDRKNLKLHLQNHDKAVYYACNTCGFKFGKREYYENHIRYIHPLPDGSILIFSDMDQHIALEQLKEIEKQEQKERQEKEGKNGGDSVLPVNNDVESVDNDDEDDDDEDDDDATEITVTEGLEENPKLRKCDGDIVCKDEDIDDQILQSMKEDEANNSSDEPCVVTNPQVGTDIRISRGTLSFTQTVSDVGTQDEDLVNKVIADAVNQAANTIESLQTIAGANMSGNDIDLEDDDDDEEDEDDMMEDDEFQEILDAGNYEIIPIAEQKPVEQLSEIHINASVGGQKKKFIIQVPAGSSLSVQTTDGMEMIVSMVNQLCGGKELDGPIEVVMHTPGARTLSLE